MTLIHVYVIRPAVRADAGPIADLASTLGYGPRTDAADERVTDILADQDHVIFVAETKDDEVVGWIHAFVSLRVGSDNLAEVAGLAVAELQRRRGVGRALVNAVSVWAREKGMMKVRVRMNETREEAGRFYERLGFQLLKRQRVLEMDVT